MIVCAGVSQEICDWTWLFSWFRSRRRGRGFRWESDDSTDFRTWEGRRVSSVSGCNCSPETDQGEEEDFKDDCQDVGGLEVPRSAGQETGLEKRRSGKVGIDGAHKNVWEPINLALFDPFRIAPFLPVQIRVCSSNEALKTDEP